VSTVPVGAGSVVKKLSVELTEFPLLSVEVTWKW
jgi:hypothetical protein